MKTEKNFNLSEVTSQLLKLRIPYAVYDAAPTEKRYAFKSLRRIEDRGIYYFAGGIANPPVIANSIILCSLDSYGGAGNVTIRVVDPQLAFYQLMESLVGQKGGPRGIHSTALVGEGCEIHPAAYIGPYCVLEGCVVRAGANLHSHVVVMRNSVIEEEVTIEPHSTIGATGVAWIWEPDSRRRIVQPQTGAARICRGSFLGSDVTVVRGSVNEETVIEAGCVIAHGSKIGHGSLIGEECHFANNVSVAGNVTLGARCFLGSGVVIRSETRLAERTVVGAGAVVVQHCDVPGQLLIGAPAKQAGSAKGKMSGVPKSLDN